MGSSDLMSDASRCDECFRRNAPCPEAIATDPCSFNSGNAEPEFGSSDTRGGQAGCPQADDDKIKWARHGTTVVAVIARLDVRWKW